MIINLLEIPNEGKLFVCNNQTAEFNEVLYDLIQNTTYQTEFTIRPLEQGTFELTGFVKTELPEQCSRCGLDFQFKVDEKFKEMLLPELDQPRNSKYAKANHFSDLHHEGPSVTEYQGHHFNMGEYLHEVVALSAPYNPCAPVDIKGKCSICGINVFEKTFNYDEDFEKPESPFSVLKNIKLN